MGFVNRVASVFPTLKTQLRIAHIPYTTIQFVNKNLKISAIYALMFTMLSFFVLKKANIPVFFLVLAYMIFFALMFQYSLAGVKAKIKKRELSEKKRYKRYYGVDYLDKKLYNYVIDTTKLNPNEVVGKIIKFVKTKKKN